MGDLISKEAAIARIKDHKTISNLIKNDSMREMYELAHDHIIECIELMAAVKDGGENGKE